MGLGGDYGLSSPWRLTDGPGPWAVCFGIDFNRLNALPTVDYSVAHMYENARGSWVSVPPGRIPPGSYLREGCMHVWAFCFVLGDDDRGVTVRLSFPHGWLR